MTICLAALCDKAQRVVIASDRMLTGGDVEFEQDIRKFEAITEGCVILSAGSALDRVDLMKMCRADLSTSKSPGVADVVSSIKDSFVKMRLQRATELHLQPLGLTLKDFLTNQQVLSPDLVLRLTHNIEHERLGVQLLVAGVDSSGGHIYLITDPGISSCFDAVGFCAIGSGEHHADLAFIRANYSEKVSLRQALFLAYRAKRDAETAPGVGTKFSDLIYIDINGCQVVSDGDLAILRAAYETFQRQNSAVDKEIKKTVESLKLNEGGRIDVN